MKIRRSYFGDNLILKDDVNKEVKMEKENKLKWLAKAMLEKERYGQLSPQSIERLKKITGE